METWEAEAQGMVLNSQPAKRKTQVVNGRALDVLKHIRRLPRGYPLQTKATAPHRAQGRTLLVELFKTLCSHSTLPSQCLPSLLANSE